MNISFIGLGRMGRELASRVAQGGHDLTVWNRSVSAADAFADRARIADSPETAVADADVVITALFGPDAVRSTVVTRNLPLPPGSLWIDVTTVGPADAAEFEAWSIENGVGFVHSPVIGSLEPARAGQLGVLLGGASDAVRVARKIVALWADPERILTYDRAAKAASAKLVANLTVAVSMQGLVEALRLGKAGELSQAQILELTGLPKTPFQGITALKAEMLRNESFDQTQFSAALLAKDIGLMLALGSSPLPALTTAYASLEESQRAGHGNDDFATIARRDVGWS